MSGRLRVAGVLAGKWIALFLGFGLCAAVVVPFNGFRALSTWHPRVAELLLEVIGLVAVVLPSLAMIRFLEKAPVAWLGLPTHHLPRDLGLGFLLGTGWLGLCLLGAAAFRGLRCQAPPLLDAALGVHLLAVTLNAASQELLVRGYPFQTARAAYGDGFAVLLTSILFSALHGAAFQALLPALNVFLAGLLLAVARLKTGALWLPIAAHAAWNFLLGPFLGLDVSGHFLGGRRVFILEGPSFLTGGAFGLEGGLPVTVVTLILTAGLYLALRPAKS